MQKQAITPETDAWQRFTTINRELADLRSVAGCLSWDQETMMPAAGGRFRARQASTMASIYHSKVTDPAYGELLNELQREPPESAWDRTSLREAIREHERATRLPASLVRELARTTSLAYHAWVEAREKSDFEAFSPWLEKIFDLKRQEAECGRDSDHLYDVLLDDYEAGMTVARLDPLFETLRPRLSRLVAQIEASPYQPKPSLLSGTFPVAGQQEFGKRVITAMGFDWDAGRLDVSPHPFCCGLTPGDVRITTRYSESDFSMALFGVIHETGHALYEQGLDRERFGEAACQTISLGIHESQSRLWEICVGRGKSFWRFWYPQLQEVFPGLSQVPLLDFLHAINRVEAGLIRVDADEVTYGLHVILRYELEKALLSGNLKAADLDRVWTEKMEEYLGVTPDSSANGVLQDVHWSHGLVGYFPTYLLGTLYANQFFRRAREVFPDLMQQIGQGEMMGLRDWLRREIHQPGRSLSADDLVLKVTGEALNPNYFLDNLSRKYGELYGLD